MRAISASGTLASVTAGSSMCRRLAPIIVALPDSRLSITLMPVIRGGSSPTGISPPTGSQPRPAANSTSSIRPSQKIGIDTPNRVSVITTASKRDPCRIAASTPTGTPHRLASSSDASASCSVTGNPVSTSSSAGRLLWIETPRSPRSASSMKRPYCTHTG